MARPRKKGLDYFSHDTNASMDLKISAMEMQFGLAGYAFYFKLLEILYMDGGLNVNDPGSSLACAKKIGLTKKKFNDMLLFAVSVGLFDKAAFESSGQITSRAIQERINTVSFRRVSAAETTQKPSNNPAETPQYVPQIKEKKIKEKERKGDTGDSAPTVAPPPPEEPEPVVEAEKPKRKTDPDPDFAEVVQLYQSEIHPVTPTTGTDLGDWYDDVGKHALIYAITEAARNNVRTWPYIERILNSLKSEGCTSEAQLTERKRKRKRGGKAHGTDRQNPANGCAGTVQSGTENPEAHGIDLAGFKIAGVDD